MAKGKCPVCECVGYLQVLNKGKYARIRHYDRMQDGKPKFHYNQISLEESNRILALDGELNTPKTNAPLTSMTQTLNTNDPETKDLGLEPKNECGRRLVWFRTQALQACDPGFKSRRPHHNSGSNPGVYVLVFYIVHFHASLWEARARAIWRFFRVPRGNVRIVSYLASRSQGQ
jgi:hypothetical protein